MRGHEPAEAPQAPWQEARPVAAVTAEQELRGRVALVTGASRGLGRHIAVALARAGADVAITYLNNAAAAAAVVAAVEGAGRRGLAIQADGADADACRRAVAETVSVFGRIDIVVNNVGEFAWKPVHEHSWDEFDRIIRGTAGTTFYTSLAALPHMRAQRWGRIVNIGAAGAERAAGMKRAGPHLAGKSAVLSLTRTLALEEGPHGITANAVIPGVIHDRDRSRAEALRTPDTGNPTGHAGSFEDIADAVLFLVSPRAGFVNGAAIAVTGGWRV